MELTPRRLGFQPRLDGLRGVAIAFVVLYHVGLGSGHRFFTGGFLGVHVFFALSGFLITALLLQEWEEHGTISLRRFYLRRVLRLAPPLAVFLGFWLVVALAFYHGYPRDDMLRFVLVSVLYCANVFVAYGGHIAYSLTWTLSQEEQFYALWPLTLLVLLRRGWRRTRVFALLAALALASAGWRFVHWRLGTSWRTLYFDPLAQSDVLLLGCCAAVAFTYAPIPRLFVRWRNVLALAALAFVFYWAWSAHVGRPFLWTGGYLAMGIACATLLLAAVGGAPVLAWLELRPLRYLGKISYTVYLWNGVIIAPGHLGDTWPKRIAGVALSLVIGAVSYRFFERRFLLRKARHAPRERQSVDVAVAVSPSTP